MNQETEQENNNKIPEEKLKEWREEYFKYCEGKGITVLDVEHLEFYLAACKKRQEEYDNSGKQYQEMLDFISSKDLVKELTTLRANHEEFARKMGDEIHARNNHVRELKEEIHRLKDLVKRARVILTKDIYTMTFLESVGKFLKDAESVE